MTDTIGIHISQIKRYESGDTQPSLDVSRKIAIALNVNLGEGKEPVHGELVIHQ